MNSLTTPTPAYTVAKHGRKWLATFKGMMPNCINRVEVGLWGDSEPEARAKMDKFLTEIQDTRKV